MIVRGEVCAAPDRFVLYGCSEDCDRQNTHKPMIRDAFIYGAMLNGSDIVKV